MFWQESSEKTVFSVPDTVQDLSFRFHCTSGSNAIPVDHGLPLCQAIFETLPWLDTEPVTAIHNIYGAATGNGWTRPESSEGGVIHVSRRTRLRLRLPKERLSDARQLENTVVKLRDQEIQIGEATARPLIASRTLFCRSLIAENVEAEQQFTEQLVEALGKMDISVTKLLCGKAHQVCTSEGPAYARSVMLADLSLEDAITLQQQGLGSHKLLGCGIFLPHKDIAAVGSSQDDA